MVRPTWTISTCITPKVLNPLALVQLSGLKVDRRRVDSEWYENY